MHPVIGADPYRRVFSAVALDERGGVLGRWQGSTTRQGVLNLRQWAGVCAPGAAWAIEGANSLRRSLSIALVGAGADVRDVCPTRTADRQRRLPGHGKSDAVDAEAIARELLAHPDLPWALKAATPQGLDPARDALIVLVRARRQIVDRHRRLLNEADVLLCELPTQLAERLPGGSRVEPRLEMAARLRLTGERATDLRLRLLRNQAREERALASERDGLEREMQALLRDMETSCHICLASAR